jgi:hypothetical protein
MTPYYFHFRNGDDLRLILKESTCQALTRPASKAASRPALINKENRATMTIAPRVGLHQLWSESTSHMVHNLA